MFICASRIVTNMGMQLTRIKLWKWKMFWNTTTTSPRSISLRILGAIIAMAFLLWTIPYGYQATTEARRHPLHGQWISRIGVLIMLFCFLLLALGLPIIVDLFLRLSEELQCPEETDIHQGSNLEVKVDVSA